MYGDQGNLVSWDGSSNMTIVLNRPASASSFWVVVANAQKQDSSGAILIVEIVLLNGTVVSQAQTSAAYGLAQTSFTFTS